MRRGMDRLVRPAARALLAAILVAVLPSPAAAYSDPAVARTDAGLLRGTVTGSYRLFQGIPFAAPPIGRGRFAPPAPVPTGRASETPAPPATAVPSRRRSPGSRPARPRTA